MRHKLRQLALNLVMDTPIESLARAIYGRMTGLDAPDRQEVRILHRISRIGGHLA